MTLFMFLSLFMVCFVSATLWPLASETVFLSLLHQNSDALLPLLFFATLGNALGALLMFELAVHFKQWIEKKYDQHEQELFRWRTRLGRYGTPLLVLSWLPLIGDFLPIAGGLLKLPRYGVYFWITLGKFTRYAVLSLFLLK